MSKRYYEHDVLSDKKSDNSLLKSNYSVFLIKHSFRNGDDINVIDSVENVSFDKAIQIQFELEAKATELNDDNDADHIVIVDSNTLSEGFAPSKFLKVGRHLIELQDDWVHAGGTKYRVWTVFADGRGIGSIRKKDKGKIYQTYKEKFDNINDAIGYLIDKNARPAKVVWTTGDII